jgi:hypothetical protein
MAMEKVLEGFVKIGGLIYVLAPEANSGGGNDVN